MARITDKVAADLIVTAFEGGSNYWYNIIDRVEPKVEGKPWGEEEYTPWYIAYPFTNDGAVIIADLEETYGMNESEIHEEIRAGNVEAFYLCRTSIAQGKRIMEQDEKYNHHFADVLKEEWDADTADVFLQLCLFGEIVYG